MITQLKLQDTDLWEVWIEYDQFDPTHFGTLYVTGEIPSDPSSGQTRLHRSKLSNENRLILQIPYRSIGRNRMKEVIYSEPVKEPGQYRSVCVYEGDDMIMESEDIEVLI